MPVTVLFGNPSSASHARNKYSCETGIADSAPTVSPHDTNAMHAAKNSERRNDSGIPMEPFNHAPLRFASPNSQQRKKSIQWPSQGGGWPVPPAASGRKRKMKTASRFLLFLCP